MEFLILGLIILTTINVTYFFGGDIDSYCSKFVKDSELRKYIIIWISLIVYSIMVIALCYLSFKHYHGV
jgi:hypothetical protein